MAGPEREIRKLVMDFAAALAELMERQLHETFRGGPVDEIFRLPRIEAKESTETTGEVDTPTSGDRTSRD